MNDHPPDPAHNVPAEADLDAVLLRVGRLNYAWSNTESLLIHMLAGLTGMAQNAAVVVFLSTPSTRGRIELAERLAKLRLAPGPQLTELLELPSGGDTSYANMVLHDGLLNVSYYSSHEGKTSIYFAKVSYK